jgi:hypothetical protein
MEAMALAVIVFAVIGGLVVLDLLALRFGVDSREAITDDHARPAGT